MLEPISEHPDVQRLIQKLILQMETLKTLKRLLQEGIDLYFEFSNKDDFDKWVLKTKQALGT